METYEKLFKKFLNEGFLPSLIDDFGVNLTMKNSGNLRNRVIVKLQDGTWYEYSQEFYSEPEWDKLDYGEETEQIIFDQDIIPDSNTSSISRKIKKYLIGKQIPVVDVYLGEM
jgi:hypothetical protein